MKRRTDLTPFDTPATLHVVVDDNDNFLANFDSENGGAPIFVGDTEAAPASRWFQRREALNWQLEDREFAEHLAAKASEFVAGVRVKVLEVNGLPAKLCGACGIVKTIVPANWYKAPGRIAHLENRCKKCARKPERNTCPRGLSTPERATHGTKTRVAMVDRVKQEGARSASQSAPQDKSQVVERAATKKFRTIGK